VRWWKAIQGQRGEEFAVEGGHVQALGQLVVGEDPPQNAQGLPKIVVAIPGGAGTEQAPQAQDAIVVPVEWVRTDEAALLRHEEEEETVDDAQELAVEVLGADAVVPAILR
jgi:hypothetical protein